MKKNDSVIILFILVFIGCSSNRKDTNKQVDNEDHLEIQIPYKYPEAISIYEPPSAEEVDSFMKVRTKICFQNLCGSFIHADLLYEEIIYALVAVDKFQLSEGYCEIALCMTNLFQALDISKHSQEIAMYYLKKGIDKHDKCSISAYEEINKISQNKKLFLAVKSKYSDKNVVALKNNSLLGVVDDYERLKEVLYDKKRYEELLFYSFIMADKYEYTPAKTDVIKVIEKFYKDYKLGKFGTETTFFCSFFRN